MATLDVTNVMAVYFPVSTVVTVPGGTYTANANQWYGVPGGTTSMTVSVVGPVGCMEDRASSESEYRRSKGLMTIDKVETSV